MSLSANGSFVVHMDRPPNEENGARYLSPDPSMGSLSFTREGSSSARVLPLKIYTPTTKMDEDKENCNNQQIRATPTKATAGPKTSPKKGQMSQAHPAYLRQQIALRSPMTPPRAPPPTSVKAAHSENFLEKIATSLVSSLSFLPYEKETDKNAIALSQVSAKLGFAQLEQPAAFEKMDSEQMRRVPIVNADLAAKLTRRKLMEAEEEAKTKAASRLSPTDDRVAQMMQEEMSINKSEAKEEVDSEQMRTVLMMNEEAKVKAAKAWHAHTSQIPENKDISQEVASQAAQQEWDLHARAPVPQSDLSSLRQNLEAKMENCQDLGSEMERYVTEKRLQRASSGSTGRVSMESVESEKGRSLSIVTQGSFRQDLICAKAVCNASTFSEKGHQVQESKCMRENADEDLEDVEAARKAAVAALQLDALEKKMREREERLSVERQRLDDIRAKAEAQIEEHRRQARTERIHASLSQPVDTTEVKAANACLRNALASVPAGDAAVAKFKIPVSNTYNAQSKVTALPSNLSNVTNPLVKFEQAKAAASIASVIKPAANVEPEETHLLKVDARLSNILKDIDQLIGANSSTNLSQNAQKAERMRNLSPIFKSSCESPPPPPAEQPLVQEISVDSHKSQDSSVSQIKLPGNKDKVDFSASLSTAQILSVQSLDGTDIVQNEAKSSEALEGTDLVSTPHHKMFLHSDMAFATPGTTSVLVNDWCRSLEVKTRPLPRETVNSEEVRPDLVAQENARAEKAAADKAAADAKAAAEAKTVAEAYDNDNGNEYVRRQREQPVMHRSALPLQRSSQKESGAQLEKKNQGNERAKAESRAAQLESKHAQLEHATQIALETAFHDTADWQELTTSCKDLIWAISDYEGVKGQPFPETHSYIRLKVRLMERIRIKEAELEKDGIVLSERTALRESSGESTVRSWADLPLGKPSSQTSPRGSTTYDTPRVGLRIANKGSGHVVVVDLVPGTPAEMSGQIYAGDIIEQADGRTLIGMYIADVVALISGGRNSSGTDLCMRLLRDSSARITVRIRRADKMEIVPKPQASFRAIPPEPQFTMGQREMGPQPPPRLLAQQPTAPKFMAPPLPSRPSNMQPQRQPAPAPAPSLPPRPQNVQGGGRIMSSTSMSSWMNQPTYAHNHASANNAMSVTSTHAPRPLPHTSGSSNLPRMRNQPNQGWFGGDLLGSINDAIGIGGVTENIFKVVAKDLGNNSNHFQKNNKQGTRGPGGLPYERYHQGKLIYNRTPALIDQPAAYDNHACPDSPGTINAVRKEFRAAHESEKLSAPPLPSRPQNVQMMYGGRARSEDYHNRTSGDHQYLYAARAASHGDYAQISSRLNELASKLNEITSRLNPDGSSGMLL